MANASYGPDAGVGVAAVSGMWQSVGTTMHTVRALSDEQSYNHTHADHLHEDHVHAHVAILFLFVALIMGALTMAVTSRYLTSIPYTCAMLVEGFLVGILNHRSGWNLGAFSESLQMFASMDPHLLLFTFLPALLFSDSMGLNWHMWKRCLGQCMLLAGPGVLIGCALTAAMAYYVFPYGWSWQQSMMFGSILAATDPVAVVSILKELGAPPKLTMCVSGEALLNDGTAIVLFNLFKALCVGPEALEELGGPGTTKLDTWLILKYFCWMALGATVLGGFFGIIAVVILGNVKRRTNHTDVLVQITTTMCLAYLTFFIAEYFVGVSGVIATVCAALVFAAAGWPYVASRETMDATWHFVEYALNTVIFTLAGTIMGDSFGRDRKNWKHLSNNDWWYLLVCYVGSMAIRFFMVLVLYPCLSRMGNGFSCKDFFMLSWGGLRGAVGLALALDVDLQFTRTEKESVMGSKMLFHVGGMAALTLVINGITSAPCLRILGMASSTRYQEALLEHVESRIQHHAQKVFDDQITEIKSYEESGMSAYPELRARVLERVQSLQIQHRAATHSVIEREIQDGVKVSFPQPHRHSSTLQKLVSMSSDPRHSTRQASAIRELFLAMLKSRYSELVDRGVLTAQGQVAIILHESIDVALDQVHETLSDWVALEGRCHTRAIWNKLWAWSHRNLPAWFILADLLENSGLSITERSVCHTLLCFVHCHKKNQCSIQELLSGAVPGTAEFEELRGVIAESEDEVKVAESMLAEIDSALVHEVQVDQISNVILHGELDCIDKLLEEGCLTEKQAHHFLEELTANIKRQRRLQKRNSHQSLPHYDAWQQLSKTTTGASRNSLRQLAGVSEGLPTDQSSSTSIHRSSKTRPGENLELSFHISPSNKEGASDGREARSEGNQSSAAPR